MKQWLFKGVIVVTGMASNSVFSSDKRRRWLKASTIYHRLSRLCLATLRIAGQHNEPLSPDERRNDRLYRQQLLLTDILRA